jgi:hypothetical protein
MRTDLVLDALRMALAQRRHGADVELVHHSDAGSQPELNRSSQHRVIGERTVTGETGTRRRGPAAWLSSRRLARRAGWSGDSHARACWRPAPVQRAPGSACDRRVRRRRGARRVLRPGSSIRASCVAGC